MSNFFVQELVLYRHFMLIDSPIPFELVANPTNYRKDEHGNVLNSDLSEITGRDICSRPAGAWRVDCWALLPEKYHKQNPVFTMLIKYDRDLLDEGEIVDIRYSDIDIGEGVAGVNGQLVSIPSSDFRPVVSAVNLVSDKIGSIDNGTVLDKLSEILSFFPHSRIYGSSVFRDSVTSIAIGEHRLFFGTIHILGSNGRAFLNGLFDAFREDNDEGMERNWQFVSLFCKGYLKQNSSDFVIISSQLSFNFVVPNQDLRLYCHFQCETGEKSLTFSNFSTVDLFPLGG